MNRDKLNSSNLYEYASSNPVSYIDPSGLWDAQNGGGQKRINIGDEHVYIKDETYEANPVDQESSSSTGNHQVSSGGNNTINEVKENITNSMVGSKADDIVKSVSNSFSSANQIGKHLVNQVGISGVPGIAVGVGMDYVSNRGEGFDLTRSIIDGFLIGAAGALLGGIAILTLPISGPLAVSAALFGGGLAAGAGSSLIKNSRNKRYLTPRKWGDLVNSLWD